MIAIFDLDGTLALTEHRQHFLEETPKNWEAFNAACGDDRPNVPITNLLVNLLGIMEIYILSGRSVDVKYQTLDWLVDNIADEEWQDTLFMRRQGDFRDDTVVKREMFESLKKELIEDGTIDDNEYINRNFIIFEDRQKVVDMWREMGLTCCQVAPGAF